jgi:hypothetical protein
LKKYLTETENCFKYSKKVLKENTLNMIGRDTLLRRQTNVITTNRTIIEILPLEKLVIRNQLPLTSREHLSLL